jgi:hypothetical protein
VQKIICRRESLPITRPESRNCQGARAKLGRIGEAGQRSGVHYPKTRFRIVPRAEAPDRFVKKEGSARKYGTGKEARRPNGWKNRPQSSPPRKGKLPSPSASAANNTHILAQALAVRISNWGDYRNAKEVN